jgi:DNA-binding HxlR family transcriptional regulator
MRKLGEMSFVPLQALDRAARLVGDRWSLLVLAALLDGERRYGELLEQIPGISTNVLAQRLAGLEAEQLVIAEPYSRRPPRVCYSLTADGRGLTTALAALSAWGAARAGDEEEVGLRHVTCGTPLEARWRCPTCDTDVDLQATTPEATIDDAVTFNA